MTSSPLYQPMDTMERLGYEVRVYMRVPDLGLSFFIWSSLTFESNLLFSLRR